MELYEHGVRGQPAHAGKPTLRLMPPGAFSHFSGGGRAPLGPAWETNANKAPSEMQTATRPKRGGGRVLLRNAMAFGSSITSKR